MLNVLPFCNTYKIVPIFVCYNVNTFCSTMLNHGLTLSENGYQFGNQTWRGEKY